LTGPGTNARARSAPCLGARGALSISARTVAQLAFDHALTATRKPTCRAARWREQRLSRPPLPASPGVWHGQRASIPHSRARVRETALTFGGARLPAKGRSAAVSEGSRARSWLLHGLGLEEACRDGQYGGLDHQDHRPYARPAGADAPAPRRSTDLHDKPPGAVGDERGGQGRAAHHR